jgi:hypothetical protein
VSKKISVTLSANFERNLAAIEVFLSEVGAPQAYDLFLDSLADTVIPNLEQFPAMGRLFLARPVYSVEVANALARLHSKLGDGELREYLFGDYLVLYVQYGETVHLLSIKHHRQLSFDFQSLWPRN